MEWWLAALVIFGSLFFLMSVGLPVAFAFMVVCLVGAYLLWGPEAGFHLLIVSLVSSITRFGLLPAVLFILMGEIMFLTGLAPEIINAVDQWLGRLPGRLGLLAVAAGTLFATFTGSSVACTAMLGSTLVPEMEKRGYKKPMSLGPILGSGGLATMIPPSAHAIVIGVIGEISIGKILIAIIFPGLLMAVLYATYVIVRSWRQPSVAPTYDTPAVPLSRKLVTSVRYVLPLGFIIFMVVGLIFLGIATPSEGAATGAVATVILAAVYRKLNWRVMKKALADTTRISVMILLIVAGAIVFSQILAFSGASGGLVSYVSGLPVPPVLIIVGMMVVVEILGMFISGTPVMMISLPLFMPLVHALGFNPVWFAVIFNLNLEMGTTTPPFGLLLFTMLGVAPKGTTFGDCARAALPFLGCDLVAMVLIIAFPAIALWLPSVMR